MGGGGEAQVADLDDRLTLDRPAAHERAQPRRQLRERERLREVVVGAAVDYLTKPFSLAELTARLRALVRRGPVERQPVVEVGDLRLYPATHDVRRRDVPISLSAKEFTLLEAFMRRPGHVLSRAQLLDAAWDLGYEQRSNVVEVYIRGLREKVDRPFGVRSIETVRGVGYRLRRDGGT